MQTLKTLFFFTPGPCRRGRGVMAERANSASPAEHTVDDQGLAHRRSRVDMLISSIQWSNVHSKSALLRIQQVFDRFDKDGGGSLDRTELQLLGQCWEFYQSIGNVTCDMWVSLGVLLFHKKNPSLFIVQCHEIWSQVCIQDVVSIFQLQTNHSVRTWTWQRRGGMHGGIGQLHHRGSQWRHAKKSPIFNFSETDR